MIACTECGASLPEEAQFCSSCGTKVPEPVTSEEKELTRRIQQLRTELQSVEEALEIQSFGFYELRFGLETSNDYVERLKTVREQQKGMVKNRSATESPKNWVVDGSLKKGREMMNEQTQLMIRAFNGECDAAISAVKFDNVARAQKRLEKSFIEINKLGASKSISLSSAYKELKIAELHLVHEHREKVAQEREEQREIQRQMREEQLVQKELESAQQDAEKDASKFEKALQKARAELIEATGHQHDKLEVLVEKLQNELSAAIDRKAKSIARAQLTRSGHVYILSNFGSFGEGVFKIGMTRRLEPLERVYELGDASVPFRFDVHAMIYSVDAPELENALHREFESRRVNKINLRREYFRVSLDEIAAAVKRLHGEITYLAKPEAEEYRKTRAMEANVPPAPRARPADGVEASGC